MDSLKGLDPRPKLVVVLCLSSLAVIFDDLRILVPLVAASALLATGCGSDLGSVFGRLRRILWIFLAMALIQSIFAPGEQVLLQVGGLSLVTAEGLSRGAAIMLRILGIIISAAIMTTSTSREIVQGLAQWKVPYEVTFMVSVAIRFLPLLRDEARDTLTAMQLRGIKLEELPWRRRLRIYSRLLMPLVASVILKSRQLAVAVEMRAFRAYPQRSSYRVLKLNRLDYVVMAIGLFVTLGVLLGYHYMM